MKTTVSIFLLLLFGATELVAQGFNSFNNRNHPYLNWQVAETEHTKIIYPDRLSGIEALAAPIAEESYRALSENLDVTFDRKIRIYLSDEDEINNGFANPIGKGYTMIWVNLNDYAEIWTGSEKWLRKVIAHELGHIFHFKAVWSSLGLLQWAVADPLPVFWTEGIAQYQTEEWDSQRGDRWLRKAIFDSRPDYRDGRSIENGRLMYAKGNSQLRYFAETYGDTTLAQMMQHRKSFLGFFDVHDFDSAFRTVVDGGYSEFREEWLKHVNVYYNTLASQMERTDSLGTDAFSLPGQFYYDMAVSPDDSLIAVLSLPSMQRPVRSIFLVQSDSTQNRTRIAEGSINPDLSWSRDGNRLYYSRTVRGDRSSLINDIFVYHKESGREEQLTFSRRARYPVQGPQPNQIGYVVNEDGTGNLFVMDLDSGEEQRVTDYEGDIQMLFPVWVESVQSWLFHRFDADGSRYMVLFNPETGSERLLDDGAVDNRKFVLSPGGGSVAYTSLRDEVPNVFIYDFDSEEERRVTNLFTGGEVYGWIAERDTLETEKLLVKASETKRRDEAWWVEPDRSHYAGEWEVPEAYASWRTHQPPNVIPSLIEPDESLITSRYEYRSFRNITHAASVVLPYYGDPGNWGLFGTSGWVEPLSKHIIAGSGLLSFGDFDRSYGLLSYINNQFYPSFAFSVYKTPGSAYFYGDRFLVEELIGGDITMTLPIDRLEGSYRDGAFYSRVRHTLVRPFERERFEDRISAPAPERARQTDLTIGMGVTKQRPWRDNLIHPLDGWGVQGLLTGAEKILGSDVRFATADLSAYTVLPALGLHRLYLHGRFQQQWGTPLPQNFIGFTRLDNIQLNLPGEVPINLFYAAERVRGYRDFIAGNRVAFGSLEYRMPFLPSLQTSILGLLRLGSTSLALFTDAGVVWNARFDDGTTGTEQRWGAGAEIKNSVNLAGIRFAHSLGIAQPAMDLFTDVDYDLYYRVRATVPF
ncbi:MAG: BamA/TamA family outer membrane protein [Balneolaceae bacterium]|nr:BamA/TamA family outer membrane protein [Balneolaceae bacterium]MCH8550113.1 BamA/TamA family outer membrane protein [Balneolaceae bacterium]